MPCVRDLIWRPAGIVDAHGQRTALEHSRAPLLRGAAAWRPAAEYGNGT